MAGKHALAYLHLVLCWAFLMEDAAGRDHHTDTGTGERPTVLTRDSFKSPEVTPIPASKMRYT